jgi:hypothetical protein
MQSKSRAQALGKPTSSQRQPRVWLIAGVCVVSGALLLVTLALALLNRHSDQMWRIVDPVLALGVPIFTVVGALIALRRPANWIGWVFLVTGLLEATATATGAWAVYGLQTRAHGAPGAALALWVSLWCAAVTLLAPTFPLLLFPVGRLVDWPTRVVAWLSGVVSVVLVLSLMSGNAYPPGFSHLYAETPNPWAWSRSFNIAGPMILADGLCGLIAVALLLRRFWRSNGVQRQQYKWIVLAMVFVVASYIADFVVRGADSELVRVTGPLSSASIVAVPLTVGIAILRHQLFDIDRVINRALVYAALSVGLIGSYALGVVLLQRLLDPLTRGSDLAVAATTLLVAALARPARDWIQRAVDQRFYRRQYDAARTLDTFAMRLREQVELDGLVDDLRAVVHETMQPAHVSLWLRAPHAEPSHERGAARLADAQITGPASA